MCDPRVVTCFDCGRLLSITSPPGPAYPTQAEGHPDGARYWCRVCRPPLRAEDVIPPEDRWKMGADDV